MALRALAGVEISPMLPVAWTHHFLAAPLVLVSQIQLTQGFSIITAFFPKPRGLPRGADSCDSETQLGQRILVSLRVWG